MSKWHIKKEIRENTPAFVIYSQDYNEPLWGDYRGVEMSIIRYNSSNESSETRAWNIAQQIVENVN